MGKRDRRENVYCETPLSRAPFCSHIKYLIALNTGKHAKTVVGKASQGPRTGAIPTCETFYGERIHFRTRREKSKGA